MIPSVHLIASLFISLILWPWFGFFALAAIIGSFLIDFDHYIRFVIKNRNFNLKEAYFYFKGPNNECAKLFIFHTIETLIVLGLLSMLHIFFFVVFLGAFVHIVMDWAHDLKKIKKTKQVSIIYYFLTLKSSKYRKIYK